jgi:Fe-S-cluster-containing hydrogenase component 2
MSKVIIINSEKCTGCRMCEVSCALKHTHECNPERSRIRVVTAEVDGRTAFVPSTCMQCETAMCEIVCPTGAVGRSYTTGARIIDPGKCIACGSCSVACPFGACFVDRRVGRSVVCDQCGGDPVCVAVCPTGALRYAEADEANIRLRRAGNRSMSAAMPNVRPRR